MNKLQCFYIIFVVSLFAFGMKESPPAPTYLLVWRVGPCRDRKPSELVLVSEMSLHKENFDSTLSGEISIVKDIKNGWHVKATMQKCHDIRNLDTCDFYRAVSIIRNGCLDSEEADTYNMFYQYVSPQMDCPVTAGNYTIVNFPFFTENSDLKAAESRISTSVFGYTYRLEGFSDDDDRLLCVESHLRLNYFRDHNWTGNKKSDVGTTPRPAVEESSEDNDKEETVDDVDTAQDEADEGNEPATVLDGGDEDE